MSKGLPGGRYIRDPATGKSVRVDDDVTTLPKPPAADPAPEAAETVTETPEGGKRKVK